MKYEYDPEESIAVNQARAAYAIAEALNRIAISLQGIGLGGDRPGALEYLGMQVKDGFASLSGAVERIGESYGQDSDDA